jgi:hypothetical protein
MTYTTYTIFMLLHLYICIIIDKKFFLEAGKNANEKQLIKLYRLSTALSVLQFIIIVYFLYS